jgi:protein involved in polysaccharide export with SLBB domain
MRISDLLEDKRLLIPGSYWERINQGALTGDYSRSEVNLDYATIQRLDPETLRTKTLAFNLAKAIAKDPVENMSLQSGDIVTVYGPGDAGVETENSLTIAGDVVGGVRRFVWRPGMAIKDLIPSGQWLIDTYSYWQRPGSKVLKNDINWDYAQVIRRVPETLSTTALTFNLGNAVLKGDPADNIELQAGDQVALFTAAQLNVPTAKRLQMVSVAGEVAVPGRYLLNPGETLPQLLKRIGGLTPQAYVFGTELTRVSVQQQQQANLDKLIRRLEDQSLTQQNSLLANRNIAENSAQVSAMVQVQTTQLQAQISRMKALRSSGRVALELDTRARTLTALPDIPLEDGDSITVPTTPGFVSAYGSVNNENVFIYKPGKTVGDVIKNAGLSDDAEPDQAFVLRADGSVVSSAKRGWFSSFESVRLMPGDTLVVPARVDRETKYNGFIRGLKDWTQILSNLGIGVAAWRSMGY